MRLIDEAALINEAETGSWDIDLKELRIILKYVPTINDVPVVRGEWIKVDQVYVKCSFCEKHYYNLAREYSYCPNCGAKMEDKP